MSGNPQNAPTPPGPGIPDEDFGRKYSEDGQGRVAGRLIDGYFAAVASLVEATGLLATGAPVQAVEYGCGEGHSTKYLRALLPAAVSLEATEYLERQVPVAQRNNPGVPVRQASVYRAAEDSQHRYDLVFLLEVLEHLDRPAVALAQLAKVVRPGGWLVLGVPREPLWRALNMARGKYLRDWGNTPGHIQHFSTRTIVRTVGERFGPVRHHRTPVPWTIVAAQPR